MTSWSVLVYSCAPPNLAGPARQGLRQLQELERPDAVELGVQKRLPDGIYRFNGQSMEHFSGEMNRIPALTDFLQWGAKTFPSEHTMVVLGGHSAGFLGALTDSQQRGFMSLPDLATCFEVHRPDVLVFDSCLMAELEVAAELWPRADYLVASQGGEYEGGIPLEKVMARLGPEVTPRQAAELVVEEASSVPDRTPTMSAIDLAQIPSTLSRLEAQAGQILSQPGRLAILREQLERSPSFWPHEPPLSHFKDLEVLESWEPAVIAHHPNRGTGLSAYLPTAPMVGPLAPVVATAYSDLKLSDSPNWSQLVSELAFGSTPRVSSQATEYAPPDGRTGGA